MPLSPLRAKLKRSHWRSAFLCQLLTSVVAVALAGPSFAQPAASTGTAAPAAPTPTVGAVSGDADTSILPRGLSYSGGVDISETIASNGRGTPSSVTSSGKRGWDAITQLRLNLAAHNHTERFDGDLAYQLSGSVFARNSNLSRVTHNLTATSRTVLVPEHLELYARAFARQIYTNILGALAASDRPVASGPNSGVRQAFGYTISPDFRFRLGNFATSQTTITQSGTFLGSPHGQQVSEVIPDEDVPNSNTSYGASQILASGSDFTRLNWTLTASGRKTVRRAGDLNQASGLAALKYAVSHSFNLTGSAGYESIASEQQLTRDLRGLIAMGGFEYSPHPDLQLSAQAGRQFGFASYTGNLSYQITPLTAVTVSVTDAVTTPGQRLADGLNSLGVDGQGGFIDTRLGGAGLNEFDPSPIDGIGINDSISRFRSAILSLSHNADRTTYRLTAFGTIQDRLDPLFIIVPPFVIAVTPPPTESIGGVFSITRQFTPQISGGASLTYTMHNVLGGRTNLLRASLDATYLMTEKMNLYGRLAYVHRVSNNALVAVSPLSDGLSDAVATVGLRREF